MPAPVQIDHLVVAAATLDEGAAWCEATLGVAPVPGGRHALFGTHNRLLLVASEAFPRCYLEIIAVDAQAPPPPRRRWFGLDEAALQARLRAGGPRLLHVVARTTGLDARLAALRREAGVEAGEALAASRPTAQGLLQWRIAVRPDAALLYRGALPTLIEWQGVHPAAAMAASPVRLRELALAGLPATAVAVLGLGAIAGVRLSPRAAPAAPAPASALRATFEVLGRGTVILESE
ncbi:MAG: VOC family protein [Rubrivivax sp.]|nr:VOC family protein [Rubrivivax sp.]